MLKRGSASYQNFLWALLLFLLLVLLRVFTGFNGLYGQDAYEYNRYAEALQNQFLHGVPAGNYYWPENYPLLGAILGMMLPSSALALQFISIISHALICFLVAQMISRQYPGSAKFSGLYSFAFCGLSPFLFRNSPLVMCDSLSVLLVVAALDQSLKFQKNISFKHILLCGFFAGVAVMTRYVMAVALIVPAFIVLTTIISSRKWFFLLAGGVALIPGLLPHFLLQQGHSGEFLSHPWLTNWSPLNFFSRSFQTPDGAVHYTFPNIFQFLFPFFHPGYFALGIILIFFRGIRIGKDILQRAAAFSAGLYLLFLAGMPYQNPRFLLPCVPLACILFYPGWVRLCGWLWVAGQALKKKYFNNLIVGVVILLQVSLVIFSLKKMYQYHKLESDLVEFIGTKANSEVYSVGWEGALKYRYPEIMYRDLFKEKIDSVRSGSLLVVQDAQWEKQWKGMNVWENWTRIKSSGELKLIHIANEGWSVYEKQ